MPVFELAAIGAAFCWALSSIMAPGPVAHLGAFAFTRIRMTMMLAPLAIWVAVAGSWTTISSEHLVAILLSGAIGIFVGDTALFMTMARLGPRRTSILFSTNAPMSVVLGWLFLNEALSGRELLGIALILCGVLLAIVFGKRRSQLHQWESVKGSLWAGVGLGLVAALSQAVGSLIARPVMEAGTDPIAVTLVRVAVAVACFYLAMAAPAQMMRQQAPLNLPAALNTFVSGILAMAIGMSLLLYALSGGEVGIVTTLSATTPALLLPLIWIRTGERPAFAAWFGAALVIAGSWQLFAS